jgi:hypothetical protein
MKAVKSIMLLLASLAVCACGEVANKGVKLSEREAFRYDKALQAVESVEAMCDQVAAAPTQDALVRLLSQAKTLKYEYNEEGMNLATLQHCDSLVMRITECQKRAISIAEQAVVSTGNISVVEFSDQLISEKSYYPVYLKKGETLFCTITSSSTLTAKLYNADTERLIKSYSGKSYSESFSITNTGIYLLELIPQGKLYVSLSLGFRPADAADMYGRPSIISEQVECKKGDIGAKGIPGIVMRKCFEEPRKFTLRGKLKAAFSGNAKALVAIQVPAGATDILYSMRIATSESTRSADGKFHDNLSRSYKRVRFLGLPLYEKSTSNGLLNTLLDDNRPIREEDAYCSMYVFRNSSQAKQFQDSTKPVSQLSYDVDYSTVGTQSCNGRIPTKGSKTIYLGFENERMRYANYLWVEAEAVVPNTVYYRTKYRVN